MRFLVMKKIILKLVYLISVKIRYQNRSIYVFKPAMSYISRKSELLIDRGFYFNTQFGVRRILSNRHVGELYIASGSRFTTEEFSCYAGCRIIVNPGAKLSLGTGYMNYNSVIDCSKTIIIGHNVKISENVMIRDSDNHIIVGSEKDMEAPIIIEDNVWICMNVTILKGVTIGEGSIIAAGSIVTKDIPAHTLAAGVPAKVIKENVSHH